MVTVTSVADITRILCIALASVGLGFTAATLIELRRVRQLLSLTSTFVVGLAAVLLGLALLTVSALFTEVGRLGTLPTWRLPTNLLGVALGLYGAVLLHRALGRAVSRARR